MFFNNKHVLVLYDESATEDVKRLIELVIERSDEFPIVGSMLVDEAMFHVPYAPVPLDAPIIIGIGLGGLLACKVQEENRYAKLWVLAINAPTSVEGFALRPQVEGLPFSLGVLLDLMPPRVALYSSLYAPIADRCEWHSVASQAYDQPWLAHGIRDCKHGLSYVLASFLKNPDVSEQVAKFTTDENPIVE